MKNYILLALIGALFLVSCQDNSPECKYHSTALNLTVKQADWKFDSIANQFYYRFDLPEITTYVYDYGDWRVYREYLGETKKDDYQVVLPLSYYLTDTIKEESIVYYTQYIDYRIGIGSVDIQLTNSDRMYGTENPESMSFRLQANDDILDLNILQADWKFDETTKQYYYRFDVPEITSDVYNYGHFSICREYNAGTADAYQVALPTSDYLSEIVPVQSVVYYTQHIDYRVGIGYLDVQLTNSDYFYRTTDGQPIPPETMTFRLLLTY